MEDIDAIGQASLFAQNAHSGQLRKYTGVPYFTHCEAVAIAVHKDGGTVAQVCAAYLHDTVEDTVVTVHDLRAQHGAEVANLVEELTDVYTTTDYPQRSRKWRKQKECERYRTVSVGAKFIKIRDIAHNTRDIVEHDPVFAIVYLREKACLLEALTS